jgi:hypothetical protein
MPDDANSSTGPPVLIPDDQWNMPVSLTKAGQYVNLRDYVAPGGDPIPVRALNEQQRAAVAAKRIEMQPGYEMVGISAGIIRQDRAIREIRSQSDLGRSLTGVEMRVAMHLVDKLSDKRG